VRKPFTWKPETWYRLRLRVENLPDGKVNVRDKAWPAADSEPADWTIERIDPVRNRRERRNLPTRPMKCCLTT
jgi:hypothetical protein